MEKTDSRRQTERRRLLFYCRLDEKLFSRSFDRSDVICGVFSSQSTDTPTHPRCFYRKFRGENDSRGFNVIARRASLPAEQEEPSAFICSIILKSRSESFRFFFSKKHIEEWNWAKLIGHTFLLCGRRCSACFVRIHKWSETSWMRNVFVQRLPLLLLFLRRAGAAGTSSLDYDDD